MILDGSSADIIIPTTKGAFWIIFCVCAAVELNVCAIVSFIIPVAVVVILNLKLVLVGFKRF
jgi:hypothetical protein